MKALLIVYATILLLTFCVREIATSQIATHVVISEVYGGGGNSGSTYKNDFVELYNPTASPVVISNWSIQYATAAGSFGSGASKKTIFSGTISAHGFFLVQEAQGSGGTTNLPTPDASGTITLSAADGKVALANDTVVVTGQAASNVVDFVGYGTASLFEGAGAVGSLSNTTSAERKAQSTSTASSMASGGTDVTNGNGWDSDDNAGDFVIQSTQVPQNSLSSLEIPPAIANAPPVISSITRSPFVAEVGGVDTVFASVADNDGLVVIVRLHIRVNGGAYDSSMTMTLLSGTQYRGIISSTKHTASSNLIEYFISAIDDSSKYASSSASLRGYFVGDTRIDSIKNHPLGSIAGYGARVNGAINVRTNMFVNGQGYIQNSTGGLQLFATGGLPVLQAGRNAKAQGSIINFQGAYELGMPNFSFIDTALGTSLVSPVVVSLPISESSSNLNEGRLVKIIGLSTAATGTFAAGTNYSYHEADSDTITVRVESNANLNSLPGRTIPTVPVDAVGILSFSNTFLRLKPRSAVDMGFDPADGSGTADIVPTSRFQNTPAVSETLTVAGDGIDTIAGLSITIPSAWTWGDTTGKTLSGSGLTFASRQVTGNGTAGNPYVITIYSAKITNLNIGRIIISGLTTPSALGSTTFVVKSRGTSGSLANIINSPSVSIVSAFEATTSGAWNDPATWSGSAVPDSGDDVSFTTLYVTVTVDSPGATCHNLTMIGSGNGSNSGPQLRFENSGLRKLTVFGNVSISTLPGGLGGGGGDRGGRPQLTSNGNPSAMLVIKHNLTTTVGNNSANGNSGLNMNEGKVTLTGNTTDSVKNGASFRLGDLEVGDGNQAKTVVWAPTSNSTMYIRSLTVKSGSNFLIGSASNLNANNIGNTGSETGAVYLTGGIIIEQNATLMTQPSIVGISSADINLNGGGIINDGTLDLNVDTITSTSSSKSLSNSSYAVNIGGISGGFSSTHQIIGGNHVGHFGNIVVDGGDTLELLQEIAIPLNSKLVLDGTLIENDQSTVVGSVQATRFVSQSHNETFGGIGLLMNASGGIPGTTTVTRVTGIGLSGGSNSSIRRYFDIQPTSNNGLDATLDFYYHQKDLAGQHPVTLSLWKSTDAGNSWAKQGGVVDTSFHKIHLSGINDFSRWTASDSSHALNSVTQSYPVKARWNMISVPMHAESDSVKKIFPTSISPAYTYNHGYQQADILRHGVGYWLKFPSAQSVTLYGNALTLDTIDLAAGWNMIGSLSDSIDEESVTRIPSTMMLSPLYEYNNGYVATTVFEPAKGYWLKAGVSGKIILGGFTASQKHKTNAVLTDGLNSLIIADQHGFSRTLYFGEDYQERGDHSLDELPPLPPEGMFDVRFQSQRSTEIYSGPADHEVSFPIQIQTSAFPVTVEWKISANGNNSFVLEEVQKGNTIHRRSIDGYGMWRIDDPKIKEIVLSVVPKKTHPIEFHISENFPNPFNPSTRFILSVPEMAVVRVAIYDILGRKVKMFNQADVESGYHILEWDGTNDEGKVVESGMYFVRVSDGSRQIVKKITFLK